MQFAKVFDIEGAQVLFLLQPRDEDGLPELKMITYVGTACVVMGNRLEPPGSDQSIDPDELLAKTRELFEGFGQAEAEQAYRMAQQLIAKAQQQKSDDAGTDESAESGRSASSKDAPARTLIDGDFGVPVLSTAMH